LVRGSSRTAVGALFVAVLVLAATASASAPGDLDSSFGGTPGSLPGRVITPVSAASDEVADVAIQSDGKIVAAGFASGATAVARYTSAGTPDTGFGSGGVTFAGSAQGRRVALQPDGKIVVAGLELAGLGVKFAVFRFNADGSSDASFDGDGRATTSFGLGTGEYSYADAVALQSDGKIVVAGTAGGGGKSRVALVRYNTDGSRDSAFGSSGKVTTDVGTFAKGIAVAVQSDGTIVVAGEADSRALVLRYKPNGSLDGSFGSSGVLTKSFGASLAGVADIVLQPDGRIVCVGRVAYDTTMSESILLFRVTAGGGLDSTFGTSGSTISTIGLSRENGARGVALQSDGRILVAAQGETGGRAVWAVLRYTAAGALDTSFASGGIVQTHFSLFPGTESAYANAVAVQPDGKIVASGSVKVAEEDFSYDFALARYLVSGSTASGLIWIPPFDFSKTRSLLLTLACRGQATCAGKVVVGPGGLGTQYFRIRAGGVARIRVLFNGRGRSYAQSHPGGQVTLNLSSVQGKRLAPAAKAVLKGQSALAAGCPPSVAQGGSLAVTGGIRPVLGGATVEVSFLGPAGKGTVQRVVTDATGRWTAALTVEDAGPWQVRARWAGTKDLYGSDAPGCTAYVLAPPPPAKQQTSISLTCPAQWQQGSPLPISGSLNPAVGGATISIVYEKPQGGTRDRTATTNSNGAFSDSSVSPDQSGKWKITASWDGDSTHEGSSGSCSVQVL
jgi:uncharacterized delta-60 repeat protein